VDLLEERGYHPRDERVIAASFPIYLRDEREEIVKLIFSKR
jgi:hypothetical protein